MTARQRFVALLSQHEGLRAHVYDDATGKPIKPGSVVKGHPTVGYGLALDVNGLTERQAEWLRDDILDDREHALSIRIANWSRLEPVRRMALLGLAYQTGVGGLMGFVKMLAALQRQDYVGVARELLNSKWAKQTQAKRVEDTVRMLADRQWPAASKARKVAKRR